MKLGKSRKMRNLPRLQSENQGQSTEKADIRGQAGRKQAKFTSEHTGIHGNTANEQSEAHATREKRRSDVAFDVQHAAINVSGRR